MARNGRNGLKIWTAALSVFVAAMLFPAVVGKHGVARSATITVLAVGAIWLMYLVVGWIINGAVAKELKRRGMKTQDQDPGRQKGTKGD
jgi:hypothetical protein